MSLNPGQTSTPVYRIGRQRASRHSQFATAIRVSLNNPRNSGTLASDVAARLLRVKFTRHASSGEQQAPCEEILVKLQRPFTE
jgi:hypothetical protein